MCQQTKVLEKIHKKGAVNGYALELAEAQTMDYVTMNKKVEKIEKDVGGIKKRYESIVGKPSQTGWADRCYFQTYT